MSLLSYSAKSTIGLATPPCPQCNQTGVMVRDLTIQNLLTSEAKNKLKGSVAYYLCTDPDCMISYYSLKNKQLFNINDVKVPIWYKKDAIPIYACYCNKLTREEVLEFVKETGIDDMNKVIIRLRGKVKSTCVVKNPSGQCCNEYFNELISQGLEERE